MLKLGSPARDPYWLDLSSVADGLRVRMRPVTVAMVIAARDEAAAIFREPGADEDPSANRRAGIAMIRAVAHAGIAEWEGVAGEDGEPAPVTPENVGRFLDIWPIHDAMDRLYVEPALKVSAEGNGSSSEHAGTSEAAPTTAEAAA